MKLLKPEWTTYDGKPIFSVDVHPDGNKFATGGQGNESGRVVIWNMKPVLVLEAELDKNCPKILCQLDNHLQCVNSVRWSLSGDLLASGGDDKLIMIWKKGKGPSAVFGNSGITKTSESWRCISTLRGHAGDVLDLSWSPQDRWLASASVDNTIIIWDMLAMPTIVTVLKGHTGLVKGVTWDPVGKFMASQSDDRSVKIWKTADWTCQSTITEPFEECGGTTHVLRLSWSPDGLYLVSAHAMNGGGPTAQIIEREGFKCDKDFVGHRKAVTCVRFHNSILQRLAPKTNKSQQYCCLAMGSRDRSLSVWMTALQRPLVVIKDLFEDSILDLSWNTDHNILLACSTDGTVACLQFGPTELGTPLSEEDKNLLYQRMYGKSIDVNAHPEKDMITEYAELVNVNHEKSLSSNGGTVHINMENNNMEVLLDRPSTPVKAAIHKQIETRTADGKRRITPMFIPLDEEITIGGKNMCSSSRTTSSIQIEKTQPDPPPPVVQAQPPSSVPKRDVETANDSKHIDTRLTKQAPIKNHAIVENGSTPTNPASSTANAAQSSVALGTPTISSATKRNHNGEMVQSPFTPKLNVLNAGKALPLKGNSVKSTNEYRVQILNATVNTTFGPLCKVTCCPSKLPIKNMWEIFIGSPVVNVCLSSKYVLSCSIDGTLRFLDIQTGILVLPIVKLPTAAVQCSFSFNGELGGVVTECGTVRIWNIVEQCIYLSASCSDILGGSYVSNFHISEVGIVFVLLSNSCSYSYSKKLESWIVVNSRDPIIRHGVTTAPINPNKNIRVYPLNTIQSVSQNFHSTARSFADIATNEWQHTARLAFIENQIKICEAINSPVELEHWYSVLGSHLASHGTEKRIRILLDGLLGPTHHSLTSQTITATGSVLGVCSHKLLRMVLANFRTTLRWQRIYMEYSEQLNNDNVSITDAAK